MAESDQLLNYLCKTISDKVLKRKQISEKIIMDFSLLIADLIHSTSLPNLPNSFEKMVDIVERYCLYSKHQDEDIELSFSYIRIYQTIYMLKRYTESKKLESTIKDDAVRFKKQRGLLQIVHDNPGITLAELSRILRISSSKLKEQIAGLVEQEYICTYVIGKVTTYSLSNKGLSLYKLLC